MAFKAKIFIYDHIFLMWTFAQTYLLCLFIQNVLNIKHNHSVIRISTKDSYIIYSQGLILIEGSFLSFTVRDYVNTVNIFKIIIIWWTLAESVLKPLLILELVPGVSETFIMFKTAM